MALNPYTIVFLLLGAIGLFGSGVSIGYRWEKNAHLAAVAESAQQALDDASVLAEVESAKAAEAEKLRADARAASRERRHQLELEAMKNANCAISPAAVGLLTDSIRQANGADPDPRRLPDKLPSVTGTRSFHGERFVAVGK